MRASTAAPAAPDQSLGQSLAPTQKGKERVRQILEEARLLFAEQGYAGLSLREIARRLAIPLGNVQHYFGRKEHLFVAMIRYIAGAYYTPSREIAHFDRLGPRERLEATVRFIVEDLKNPTTNAIFFELWSVAQRDAFVASVLDDLYAGYIRMFDKMFAAISPATPARLRHLRAALAVSQIEGLMVLVAANRPRSTALAGIEEECLAQILRLASDPDRAEGRNQKPSEIACESECEPDDQRAANLG